MLKNYRISDIYAWNEMLVEEGTKLDNYRKDFFDKTLKEFHTLLEILKPYNVFDFFDVINISFFQGWDNEKALLEILEENKQTDIRRKTTTSGPHKSDIKFLIKDIDAKQILSRGEQKFFSILWSCAQHEVLKKHYRIDATLIIDDIRSELDDRVFNLFKKLLEHNKNQVIFSCIDDCFSSKISSNFKDFKKFHVEQLR
jgi:DNA replication and repair protein RecF